MPNHHGPDCGKERIAQDGDGGEGAEEEDVEAEEYYGEVVKPAAIVGETVEEDGYDARTH